MSDARRRHRRQSRRAGRGRGRGRREITKDDEGVVEQQSERTPGRAVPGSTHSRYTPLTIEGQLADDVEINGKISIAVGSTQIHFQLSKSESVLFIERR